MLPHERLFQWFKVENEGEQQRRFESLFHPDAAFDGEASCWGRVQEFVKVTPALREVRCLVAQGNDDYGVVVVEGRDPATETWRRVSWAFLARNGQILKVTSTTSQPLLPPEERMG